MPVFVSHKKEDSEEASRVHQYLLHNGVPAYVDLLEMGGPGIQSDEDITKKILQRLGECTHLMAVVSQNTKKSWWVPFEIGVAMDKKHRISTLNYRKIELPEYLNIWSILLTQEHLDKYITYYKLDKEWPRGSEEICGG